MTDAERGPRYPHRPMAAGPRTFVDGEDLGPVILPTDLYVVFKRALDLHDDEILAIFNGGAARLAALPADAAPGERLGMTVDEARAAVDSAAMITRSRLQAWRKRHRQMTWDELRIFLRGV